MQNSNPSSNHQKTPKPQDPPHANTPDPTFHTKVTICTKIQTGQDRCASSQRNIQKGDTLGFPTIQTDWKNSTVVPSYPPGTSGNLVLKKKFFVIFLTNLQPMTVRPFQAGVRRPGTAMHIQKIDTLGPVFFSNREAVASEGGGGGVGPASQLEKIVQCQIWT